MANYGVDSHGTTITFASGFFAEIIDASFDGMERGAIDVTNMSTQKAKEYIEAKLYEPGGLEVTMLYDGSVSPPIEDEPETVTIDIAGANGKGTISFTGFLTGFGVPIPASGDKVTAKATIKASGEVTFTADT